MLEATTTLPAAVEEKVNEIAEEALDSAFGVIANRMQEIGYPITGDVTPGEAVTLDRLFRGFVRAMAMNNNEINDLNEEE